MTDALTKYVKLVPLPNKEADTVANAIFDKWYCRFGAPLDIVTDQGKEFCAKLYNKLFKRLVRSGGEETRISGDSYKRRLVYLLLLEETRIQ